MRVCFLCLQGKDWNAQAKFGSPSFYGKLETRFGIRVLKEQS